MNILITNDDGIKSIGLHALAEKLSIKHNVIVVAPSNNKSACSHSLNITDKLYAEEHNISTNYKSYSLTGGPCDCVRFAVTHLMSDKPDLVISGINCGRNLGTDTMYSGTVAAALEGVYMGVTSIAISCNDQNYEFLSQWTSSWLNNNLVCLLSYRLPYPTILNINVPSSNPKGIKVATLSLEDYYKDYYIKEGDGFVLQTCFDNNYKDDKLHDFTYYQNNYITITPLSIDFTAKEQINKIAFLEDKLCLM